MTLARARSDRHHAAGLGCHSAGPHSKPAWPRWAADAPLASALVQPIEHQGAEGEDGLLEAADGDTLRVRYTVSLTQSDVQRERSGRA
jgi:hypothetical protein